MSKPYLIVVAGCNGAGKSTFSKTYVKDIVPFDFDKRFLAIYRSLQPIDIRDQMAWNQARNEFESSINGAFSNGESFCYETNFNSDPLVWVNKAKKLGYRVELHFYCLDSQELAKERVAIRKRKKGHHVDDQTIYERWKEGYKNLNLYYDKFDYVLLIDNSSSKRSSRNLFALSKDDIGKTKVELYSYKIPWYAKHRFPDIYKMLVKGSFKNRLLSIYWGFQRSPLARWQVAKKRQ